MTVNADCVEELLTEGIALHKQGRLDEAADRYQICLTADPELADAHHLLGVIAHQRGDHQSAVRLIRQAIAFNGLSAAYFSNLGAVYRSAGQPAQAIEALRRALELDADSAGIHYNLANALKDDGQFAEAVAASRRALDRDSQNAETWTVLGDALRWMGDFDESRRSHERAIRLSPRFAPAHYNLGQTCKDEGSLHEAAECFLRAACFQSDFVDAHINLGNVREDLGDFDRAIAAYDRALRLKPGLPLAQFNRALALLRMGQLGAGWDAYEARWRRNGKPRIFSQPEWDGSEAADKTLLVYSEQGVGDEILFASCFRDAIARSRLCVIECEPRLLRLFARSFPAARFAARAGEINPGEMLDLPAFDVQVAAGSLPRRLRRNFDSFPNHAGYLAPDPTRVSAWRERFDQLGAGLVVGISWKGGKDPNVRRTRSTSLQQWAPIFEIPGTAFVNLQYGECESEIADCRQQLGVTVHDWDDSDPLRDLDDFAAQIAALDLVISVDNATVHLAGALNVPVWTLLPFACDWRWFTDRSDSPWYPSMRLLRQTEIRTSPQGWDGVFKAAAGALAELAAARAESDGRHGLQLQNAGRLAEAIRHFQHSIALRPSSAETLHQLGVAWKEAGRPDLAIPAYRRSIEAEPESAAGWFNLGNALRELGRLNEAAESYQRARQICPGDPRFLVNLSVVFRELRRLDESLDCLNHVLQSHPELPAARFDRSLVQLLLGDYATGWDEYEWRLLNDPDPPAVTGTRWDGTALDDRAIFIHAEQGIGDQVMFASCLPELPTTRAKCVVECDARLVPLFARSFPHLTPMAKSTGPIGALSTQAWDFVEHLGSLPRFLRRRPQDFPRVRSYLKPDADAVQTWRNRFSRSGTALKVGISWRGGKDAETRRLRSIPIECWQPVFQVPGVRFVNLQYGSTDADVAAVRDRFQIPFDDGSDCDPLTDLDDFTAKIAALDLVLSVDNSTVHLAGAIGLPVWTLLPFSSDWRWQLSGETTPWYPTMRLLRCRTLDGWTDLLQKTARLLINASFSRDPGGGLSRR